MLSDLEITGQYWSRFTEKFSDGPKGSFWQEPPEIIRHINNRISGNPETDWIEYTLNKHFENMLPLARCLSLGCGDGNLERRLSEFSTFLYCDAYDLAEGSLQKARKLAEEKNLNNINYYAADINKLALPIGEYDSVWIAGALHHMEALEHICHEIKQSLKPEGLLILNEYIGPSRFQLPIEQKEIANLCLRLLPARFRIIMQEQIAFGIESATFRKGARWVISRLVDKLRDGTLIDAINRRFHAYKAISSDQKIEKSTIIFPSLLDMIAMDPSEAIRSEEIVKILQRDFDIIEKKDFGGNILQFLLGGIAWHFCNEQDQLSQSFLKMLINIEDTFLQSGQLKSDFAYIVARPKQVVA